MELISKISKGSMMDQVYIPKNRVGLPVGSYVAIKPFDLTQKVTLKPIFYNTPHIEPIKLSIINEILQTIEKSTKSDNIIITGSFLEKGFKFNDIDIIIITENKINTNYLQKILENTIGTKFHIIYISNQSLIKGLSTDPLYKIMLSKCISKKKLIYKIKQKINYKILDLHLLKSKPLIKNFDLLIGDEKYEGARNLMAINQFINQQEITKDKIDSAIEKLFGVNIIEKLKNNLVSKEDFLSKYKKLYNKTQDKILKGIEDDSKQK